MQVLQPGSAGGRVGAACACRPLAQHPAPSTHSCGCLPPLPPPSLPDLGDSSTDTIYTPNDLVNSYFPYTAGVGAAIHSGAWAGMAR